MNHVNANAERRAHGAKLILLAAFCWVVAVPSTAQTPPVPPAPPEMAILNLSGSGSFLGVGVTEIDSGRAKELKLGEERGVEVTKVEEDSPASKAGLQVGDVVVEYNGQRVEGTQQFVRLVQETPVGRTARMTVSRDGATRSVSAVIGSRKDRAKTEWGSFTPPRMTFPQVWIPDVPKAFTSWRSSVLGIEAEGLEGQFADFFGVKEGVLVRSVTKESVAAKAGLKAGDVIVRVEKEAVSSPRQLTSALRSHRGQKNVNLGVVRERREISLTVALEDDSSSNEGPRGRAVTRREEQDFEF